MIWSYFSTSFSASMSPSINRRTAEFIFSRASSSGISSTACTPAAVNCFVSSAICCCNVTNCCVLDASSSLPSAVPAAAGVLGVSTGGGGAASSFGCTTPSRIFLARSSSIFAPVPAGRKTSFQRSSSLSGNPSLWAGSSSRRMPTSLSSCSPFSSSGTLPITVRSVDRARRMSALSHAASAVLPTTSSSLSWKSVSSSSVPLASKRRCFRAAIASSRRASLCFSMMLCSRTTVFHFSTARYEEMRLQRCRSLFVNWSFSMARRTSLPTFSSDAAAPSNESTAVSPRSVALVLPFF
mmetsp:Transcript_5411/g.17045  ORF Transcript_5411/g.17045 Transcript_5411/m.17045 type:complete len:296 (-) Transcript_5411:518-1405(-)